MWKTDFHTVDLCLCVPYTNQYAKNVRRNEDYMHNYFVDRYGAIREVDFLPVFEKLLKHGSEA